METDLPRLQAAYDLLATDRENGVKELKALAGAGSAIAPLHLGWVYQQQGWQGTDMKEAERWLQLAQDRGEPSAGYYLGHLYNKLGQYDGARTAFEQGVSRGHLPSIYCLAVNLLHHGATASDQVVARGLLETAKRRGHVFAVRALASMYLSRQFGWHGVIYGLWLWLVAMLKGFAIAIRDPDDDRLKA